MKYTTNMNLKLPDYTDVIDIQDINDNTKLIDARLGELESISTLNSSNIDELIKPGFYHFCGNKNISGELPPYYDNDAVIIVIQDSHSSGVSGDTAIYMNSQFWIDTQSIWARKQIGGNWESWFPPGLQSNQTDADYIEIPANTKVYAPAIRTLGYWNNNTDYSAGDFGTELQVYAKTTNSSSATFNVLPDAISADGTPNSYAGSFSIDTFGWNTISLGRAGSGALYAIKGVTLWCDQPVRIKLNGFRDINLLKLISNTMDAGGHASYENDTVFNTNDIYGIASMAYVKKEIANLKAMIAAVNS